MIYVYGIASGCSEIDLDIKGIRGEGISRITWGGLSVIVSRLPDKEVSLEEARNHEMVLQNLIEEGSTVVPMSFGFSLSDEEAVMNLLEKGSDVFRDALNRIRDSIQVDLKASWENGAMQEALRDEEIKRLLAEKKEKPNDINLKIELGRKVSELLSQKKGEILPEILRLRDLAEEFKGKNTKEKGVILSSSLLLSRANKSQFLDEMKELDEQLKGLVQIEAVLPLPPYDFVGIKIEKPEFRELDEARRILGLDVETDLEEVEAAFNRLVKKHHPDKSSNPNAQNRFEEIRGAYRTLRSFYRSHSSPIIRSNIDNIFIFKDEQSETPGGSL